MYIQYSAVFQYASDGINIWFPDVPKAITCAFSRSEAFYMAKDVLQLVLHGESASSLPEATAKEQIDCGEMEEVVDIEVEMGVRNGVLYGFNVTE